MAVAVGSDVGVDAVGLGTLPTGEGLAVGR
jgi:hypothetical protein